MILKDTEYQQREAESKHADEVNERTRNLVAGHEVRNAETLADDAGRKVTDREQAGRWLSPLKFKKALKHLNPKLSFEVAHADPSKTGIYFCDGVSNEGTLYHGLRFICGMESGYSPEFSIRLEKNGAMTKEVRGWRTVLATLIRARLIEKYEAETLFKVHFGRESENWQKFVN